MRLAAGLCALMLAACVAAEAPAAPDAAQAPIVEAPTPVEPSPPSTPTTLMLNCAGAFTQGGVALCRTLPGAAISIDGVASGAADADGWAVIGFTR
jgi:hypothetical protein